MHQRDAITLTMAVTVTVLVGVVLVFAAWGTLLGVAGAALAVLGLLAAPVVFMLVHLPTR